MTDRQAAVLLRGEENPRSSHDEPQGRSLAREQVLRSSPTLDPLVEQLPLFRGPKSSPVTYRRRGDLQRLRPVRLLPLGQLRGLFLILLPFVAEPPGLGALSVVENRPDDCQTTVGMKGDWTSPNGIQQLNSGSWSVPFLNDRRPPHGAQEAVPVPRVP